ncbi:uncharacterized protein LOC114729039 [Neltuma alba]|uniref:uncharacterized protein LOC114729039 n=1 Tax=Neltuma alba TaxID=207710 RepID=UPI0010A55D9B|nr:uncharacterized protein LOC114729039 [Prosopis alba]
MGKERRDGEMENEGRDLKSQMAVRRCAKAALLLSDLKSLSGLALDNNEMLRREIEDLKIQLVKQRSINRRIKLCALSELIVQVILMLSLLTFLLMLVLKTQ